MLKRDNAASIAYRCGCAKSSSVGDWWAILWIFCAGVRKDRKLIPSA